MCFFMLMPMLLCDCQSFIKESYLLTVCDVGLIGQQSNQIWFLKNAKYGPLRRSRSFKVIEVGIPIESPYMWLILVINSSLTDILSRTVSELSQLIVHILDTLRFWAPPPLTGLATMYDVHHWKARIRLPISVNWTIFARCYGWGVTGENRSKIGDFAPTRSLWPKISGTRGRSSRIIFARIVRLMNALQLCGWQFSHKKFVADISSSEARF